MYLLYVLMDLYDMYTEDDVFQWPIPKMTLHALAGI